jgi:hypothetical protein
LLQRLAFLVSVLSVLMSVAAHADYRITRDLAAGRRIQGHAAIRDRGERVIIDGVSAIRPARRAGIVPLNHLRHTAGEPRFHQAYYDKSLTFGVVTSYAGAATRCRTIQKP